MFLKCTSMWHIYTKSILPFEIYKVHFAKSFVCTHVWKICILVIKCFYEDFLNHILEILMSSNACYSYLVLEVVLLFQVMVFGTPWLRKWLLVAHEGFLQRLQRIKLSKYSHLTPHFLAYNLESSVCTVSLCIRIKLFFTVDLLQEAVDSKGLRDDTTCIVIDIIPPEKPKSTIHSRKKARNGFSLLKNIFIRKRTSDTLSHADTERTSEPDLVEEVFEDGCPSLLRWYVPFLHRVDGSILVHSSHTIIWWTQSFLTKQ